MHTASLKEKQGAEAEAHAIGLPKMQGRPIWIDRMTASELVLFTCACGVGTILVVSQMLQF